MRRQGIRSLIMTASRPLPIRAELMVTNLIPDLIVVDKARKVVNIFELTIPAEMRIEAAHQLKANKYVHFLTDIRDYSVNVV